MAKAIRVQDYVEQRGTPMERYNIETFIYDGIKYQSLITDSAVQELDHAISKIDEALLNKNENALSLDRYRQSALQERENIALQSSQARTLKLEQEQSGEQQRAGYINAAILLAVVANLGLLIAVTLIVLNL